MIQALGSQFPGSDPRKGMFRGCVQTSMKMKGPVQICKENLLYSHQLKAPVCPLHSWKADTYGPETLILFIIISLTQFLLTLVILGSFFPRRDWNQPGFTGPSCNTCGVFGAFFIPFSEVVPSSTAEQVWPLDPGSQGRE